MFAVLAATRFAHFAAIGLLFGLAAFPFYASGEKPPRLRGALLACGVLALLTGVLELMAMAGNMGDSWRSAFDPQVLSAAVTDTMFGRVWVGRLALAVVVVGLCVDRRSEQNLLLLTASGGLLASVALTGHSAIPGGPVGLIHQVADAAHLLAAGWWVGGLLALVLASGTLGDRAPVVLGRFSRIGYAAVAVIVASGLIKSVILAGHWSALATSAYGWVLLAKIGLFAGMGLLALSNRFQITPALATGADPRRWMVRLRRQVAVEFALALLVLAVVGALGAMQPPISQ